MRQRRLMAAAGTATVVAALGFGSGASYAYFDSHGSGTGVVTTGSLSGVTVVDDGASTDGLLLPGAGADVVVAVHDADAFAVTVTDVEQSPGSTITADAAHADAGCSGSATGVSFADAGGTGGLPATVGPGATVDVHLSGAARMSDAAADACQGARFTIPVTVTLRQG